MTTVPDNATTAVDAGPKKAIDPRLANSAKLRVYLVLRRIVDPARLVALRSEHLGWMLDKERAGVLFLSGPISQNVGDASYHGLTVLHAEDIDAARRLIEDEPYIAQRVMTYDLMEWTVFEGSLGVTLSLSDSSLKLA